MLLKVFEQKYDCTLLTIAHSTDFGYVIRNYILRIQSPYYELLRFQYFFAVELVYYSVQLCMFSHNCRFMPPHNQLSSLAM